MFATAAVLAAGNAVVTGVALLVAADPTGATGGTSASVTVEIIGALAVILVAAIGVVGNYLSSRRTAPSPPGADPHDIAIHDRVTVVEANQSELRREIADLGHRDDAIDARVLPLQGAMEAKFDDVYRRLDNLEKRRR